MSHPVPDHTQSVARPAGADAPRGEGGLYLTDDVFLYRVVASDARGRAQIVELEGCYRLDVVRVTVRDLRARGLRIVRAASAHA